MKSLMQHVKEASDFLGIKIPAVHVTLWDDKVYNAFEHSGVYIINGSNKDNPYYIGRSYKNIKGRLLSHQQKMYIETREYKQKVYIPAGWKWLVKEEFPKTDASTMKLLELYVFNMNGYTKASICAFESILIHRLQPLANDEIYEAKESDRS